MKEKIIEGAVKLFFHYGVRSVSMDDVAQELAMSKKTLYQYFSNKDELVTCVIETTVEKEQGRMAEAITNAENAIQEFFLLSTCIRQTVVRVNPALMHDLKKYHPVAFELFTRFKQEFIKGQIINNIRRGMGEGYYRDNINPEVVAHLRVETIQLVFDGVFAELELMFSDVRMQLFDHFVFGLVTENGNRLYQEYLSNAGNQ